MRSECKLCLVEYAIQESMSRGNRGESEEPIAFQGERPGFLPRVYRLPASGNRIKKPLLPVIHALES